VRIENLPGKELDLYKAGPPCSLSAVLSANSPPSVGTQTPEQLPSFPQGSPFFFLMGKSETESKENDEKYDRNVEKRRTQKNV
jgi:hypothetical protein